MFNVDIAFLEYTMLLLADNELLDVNFTRCMYRVCVHQCDERVSITVHVEVKIFRCLEMWELLLARITLRKPSRCRSQEFLGDHQAVMQLSPDNQNRLSLQC